MRGAWRFRSAMLCVAVLMVAYARTEAAPSASHGDAAVVDYEFRACVSGRSLFNLVRPRDGDRLRVHALLVRGERPAGPRFCPGWGDVVQLRKAPLAGADGAAASSWRNVTLSWPRTTQEYCPDAWPAGCWNWSHPALVDDAAFLPDSARCALVSTEVVGRGVVWLNDPAEATASDGSLMQIGFDGRGRWGNVTDESSLCTLRFRCHSPRTGLPCTHYSSRCRVAAYNQRDVCACTRCVAGFRGRNCENQTAARVEPMTKPITFELSVCSNGVADFKFSDGGVRVWHSWREVPGGPQFCRGHPHFLFRDADAGAGFTAYRMDWPHWPTLPPYDNKTCFGNVSDANDHWCHKQLPRHPNAPEEHQGWWRTSQFIHLGGHGFTSERCRHRFAAVAVSHRLAGATPTTGKTRLEPPSCQHRNPTEFRFRLDNTNWPQYPDGAMATARFTCGGEIPSGACDITASTSRCLNATYDGTPCARCLCRQCEDGWAGDACERPTAAGLRRGDCGEANNAQAACGVAAPLKVPAGLRRLREAAAAAPSDGDTPQTPARSSVPSGKTAVDTPTTAVDTQTTPLVTSKANASSPPVVPTPETPSAVAGSDAAASQVGDSQSPPPSAMSNVGGGGAAVVAAAAPSRHFHSRYSPARLLGDCYDGQCVWAVSSRLVLAGVVVTLFRVARR